jgi:hypothetical protein
VQPKRNQEILYSLVCMAGVLMLIVSASKLVSLFSNPRVLEATDPFTGLTYRKVLALAVIVEAVVGCSAALYPRTRFAVLSLGSLGLTFAAYRVARLLMGIKAPCKCMGQFLNWWPWGAQHEDAISWSIIAMILIIAGLGMFCGRPSLRAAASSE